MSLVLEIDLVTGRYDAGGGMDPKRGEWPPHPGRVFAALRSVAADPADLVALRGLERMAAPVIQAAATARSATRSGYVVTNRVEAKGGNLTHVARTSGRRERCSYVPDSPLVRMIWPEGPEGSDAAMVARLDAMAARVPYLGRSTSLVLMRFGDMPRPEAGDLATLVPCEPREAHEWLRTPYDGYTDELEALFDVGASGWQASDSARARTPYRDSTILSRPAAVDIRSPYEDLVVLRFVGVRPEGRLVSLLTAALRSKVMSATRDPLPAALHGHGLDGEPHVAYLGLPDVGHAHADGHLVALAVAIPGLESGDRRAILRGVLGPDPATGVELDVRGIGRLVLRYEPAAREPRAAMPERWTRRATAWVSATPVVLDRFPKRGDDEAQILARGFVAAGLPEPTAIAISRQPLTVGAIRLAPRELPTKARGRVYLHARVEFPTPVPGPVLVGAGRYFGVGLFAPEADHQSALSPT